MWHRFEQQLRKAILRAAAFAEEEPLTTRHLLRGLMETEESVAAQILTQLGMTAAQRESLASEQPSVERSAAETSATITCAARQAMDKAYRLAVSLGDSTIGAEHVLLALLQNPETSDAGQALRGWGVTWEQAGRALMHLDVRRTQPPDGVRFPGLAQRRRKNRLGFLIARMRHLTYAATHPRQPFLPYLLFRKAILKNPYPFYARLRRRPLYWDTLIQQWIVTGYEEVTAILSEPRFSHQQFTLSSWGMDDLPPRVQQDFRRLNGSIGLQMLFQDPPAQTRQRGLVARKFTPRVIAQMQEQVQEITDALLDRVAASGHMDVIADLAFPLPSAVIARLLGVSSEEAAQFKVWSQAFGAYIGGQTTLAQDFRAYDSLTDLTKYFQAALAERRRHPRVDVMTLLVQAEEDGERLTDEEAVANCLLLLAAGHETTTQLIGNGLLALLRHPAQWARLQSDPALIDSAVEELLRFDSPVQWTSRVTREEFTWRGQRFLPGQQVSLSLGAANRDPLRFPKPDMLEITRADNRHLAFGYGSHFCLGAALARLEGRVALRTLLARFPRLRLTSSHVQWQDSFTFRALQSLPVRWD
jgi:cytochrome P450